MKRRSKKKLDNISQYSTFLPEGNNIKHDQFFKRSLEEIKHLQKQFIDKYIPDDIKSVVSGNDGLIIQPTEHIPENLVGETRADIILKTNTIPSTILHFEHQTAHHNNMMYRMMRYKVDIIEKHQLQNAQERLLPVIYQLVYHTGDKKWTSPCNYLEAVKSVQTIHASTEDIVKKYHSSDGFYLVSLESYSNESLIDTNNPHLSIFEYLMKNIHGSDLLEKFKDLSDKLNKFKSVEPELLMSAICYCAKGLDLKNNIDDLKDLFYNESEEDNGEIVMTSLQSIIENSSKKARLEGEARGEARGEAKGISVILKHNKDANLQKEFSITQSQEDQIKKLPQPPAVDQIADILLAGLVDESHQDYEVNATGESSTISSDHDS